MYSVCIIPVLVGAAAAFCDAGALVARRTGILLLGSIFIIAWLNLSNDAFDAAVGVDGDKAESVVNLTNNRVGVLWVANAFLVAGGLLLWQVVKQVNDVRVGWMLAGAIALGYMYQGPPFRLSFKGLGEPITFVTFGPLATSSFYLAHVAGGASLRPLVSICAAAASVVVGLTTASILFCSHFHQMAGDKAAGKKSPIVRLGSTRRGLQVLRWAVAATYAFAFGAVGCRWLPWTCVLTLPLSIPLARQMLQFCSDNYKVPAQIRPLKLYAVKWHTAVGLALCLGLSVYPSLHGLQLHRVWS